MECGTQEDGDEVIIHDNLMADVRERIIANSALPQLLPLLPYTARDEERLQRGERTPSAYGVNGAPVYPINQGPAALAVDVAEGGVEEEVANAKGNALGKASCCCTSSKCCSKRCINSHGQLWTPEEGFGVRWSLATLLVTIVTVVSAILVGMHLGFTKKNSTEQLGLFYSELSGFLRYMNAIETNNAVEIMGRVTDSATFQIGMEIQEQAYFIASGFLQFFYIYFGQDSSVSDLSEDEIATLFAEVIDLLVRVISFYSLTDRLMTSGQVVSSVPTTVPGLDNRTAFLGYLAASRVDKGFLWGNWSDDLVCSQAGLAETNFSPPCEQPWNSLVVNQSLYQEQASMPESNAPVSLWSNLMMLATPGASTALPNNVTAHLYGFSLSVPVFNTEPNPTYTNFTGTVGGMVSTGALSLRAAMSLQRIYSLTSFGFSVLDVAPANFTYFFIGLEQENLFWTAGGALGSNLTEGGVDLIAVPLGYTRPGAKCTEYFDESGQGFIIQSACKYLSQLLDSDTEMTFLNTSLGFCLDEQGQPQALDVSSRAVLAMTADQLRGLMDCYFLKVDRLPFPAFAGPTMNQIPAVRSVPSIGATSVIPFAHVIKRFDAQANTVKNRLVEHLSNNLSQTNKQFIAGALGVFAIVVVISAVMAYYLATGFTKPVKRLIEYLDGIKRLEIGRGLFSRVELTRSRLLEINLLNASFIEMAHAVDSFGFFVPGTVVRNIITSGKQLQVQRKIVTIMFSDLAGFTSISERLEVKDLLYIMTHYLTAMTRIVEQFDGVVAEIQGDGLLCFWNTPDDCPDHACKAIAAALAQQEMVKALSQKYVSMFADKYPFLTQLNVRIGINTANVLTGVLGSELHMKFGCLGDGVNLASRLEGLCKLYGVEILCSESTVAACVESHAFLMRELDLVQVKGKTKPVKVFEICSQLEPVSIAFSAKKGQNDTSSETASSTSASTSGANGDGKSAQADKEVRTASGPTPAAASSKSSNTLGAGRSISNFFKAGRVSSGLKNFRKGKTKSAKKLEWYRKDGAGFKMKSFLAVYPASSESALLQQDRLAQYETALKAFQDGAFLNANELIQPLTGKGDSASDILAERIAQAREKHGDSITDQQEWTGTNTLDSKTF